MSILYIVATPIGNLEDVSKRALRILSEVDLILCEDSRVAKKLLNYYEIKTPTLSYHQHSKLKLKFFKFFSVDILDAFLYRARIMFDCLLDTC